MSLWYLSSKLQITPSYFIFCSSCCCSKAIHFYLYKRNFLSYIFSNSTTLCFCPAYNSLNLLSLSFSCFIFSFAIAVYLCYRNFISSLNMVVEQVSALSYRLFYSYILLFMPTCSASRLLSSNLIFSKNPLTSSRSISTNCSSTAGRGTWLAMWHYRSKMLWKLLEATRCLSW